MICSTQATSHKLGFTLSELLVSLGVLGLIAGLTVPSIVVGVERSKNRRSFRTGGHFFSGGDTFKVGTPNQLTRRS